MFAAAVVIWAGSEVSLPLAVTSFESCDDGVDGGLLAELLPRMLPHALCVLLGSQPWATVTGKVCFPYIQFVSCSYKCYQFLINLPTFNKDFYF